MWAVGNCSILVHGWDRIKNVHCYSFLGLSTHKNVKCYPTMTQNQSGAARTGLHFATCRTGRSGRPSNVLAA